MTNPNNLSRPNNGGAGRGQGRKPLHGVRKIQLSAQLTPEVLEYLASLSESRSEVIDATIRATRAYRDWSRKRAEALLPCQCGCGLAELVHERDGYWYCWGGPQCAGEASWSRDKQVAIDEWNQRQSAAPK